ncbi:4061_t:CDS:2 [Diversispora eburnea]|uniref:4061_t:CDS:1 n=1 Tax=Diversispora eburnea TaxID=1213867 RepID=A0A9N9BTI0_9GLOM|nr:4061_t:CDS:2 [Diversispora eburnea]
MSINFMKRFTLLLIIVPVLLTSLIESQITSWTLTLTTITIDDPTGNMPSGTSTTSNITIIPTPLLLVGASLLRHTPRSRNESCFTISLNGIFNNFDDHIQVYGVYSST